MHYNIQGGLTNKIDDLQIFLDNSDISVVCLNEHWLNSDRIHFLNSLPNFNLVSFFCRTKNIHGGTCILLKNDIKYTMKELICVFILKKMFLRGHV